MRGVAMVNVMNSFARSDEFNLRYPDQGNLYALVNGTVIAETETQAGANTTSDTFSISTIAYMTAADSLVFRASASAASKTIGGSRRSACSVVYLGNTSA